MHLPVSDEFLSLTVYFIPYDLIMLVYGFHNFHLASRLLDLFLFFSCLVMLLLTACVAYCVLLSLWLSFSAC